MVDMNEEIVGRDQAMALVYQKAATLLEHAREVVKLHDWCLEKFGKAPKLLDDNIRRIAAMRDVEELLDDPIHGLGGVNGGFIDGE